MSYQFLYQYKLRKHTMGLIATSSLLLTELSLSQMYSTASYPNFVMFPVTWTLPVTELGEYDYDWLSKEEANKIRLLKKSTDFVKEKRNMHRNKDGHRILLPPIPICPIRMSGGSLWKRDTLFKWQKFRLLKNIIIQIQWVLGFTMEIV